MKKIQLLILLGIFTYSAQAQHPIFPLEQNKKWGAVDTTGEILIEPKYDFIWFFLRHKDKNAVAIFLKDGKQGLISRKGKLIQKPIYDQLDVLKNGKYLRYQSEGAYGLYDLERKKAVSKPIYESRMNVLDNSQSWIAVHQDGKYGLWGDGKTLIPTEFKYVGISKSGSCPEFYCYTDTVEYWYDCEGKLLKSQRKEPEIQTFATIEDLGGIELSESVELAKSPHEILQEKVNDGIKVHDLMMNEKADLVAFVSKNDLYGMVRSQGDVFVPIKFAEILSPADRFGYIPLARNYAFVRTSEGLGAYVDLVSGQVFLPKK